jgi:starch synthase
MMRATAVVASDVGGLREVVSHGCSGHLVPPGDARALAAALLDLLRDPAAADRMGRDGREIATSRFGIDAHVERFLGLYRRIASTPVASPGAA